MRFFLDTADPEEARRVRDWGLLDGILLRPESAEMSGRDARTFIRVDPSKQGSNDQIPSDIELESWDLPLQIQFGISTNPIKTDTYRWTVAADAIHPSDNYESVNVGTEFAYREFLFLRGGFNSLFQNAREGGLCFGVGVSSSGLLEGALQARFDYAFRHMGRLEDTHTLSLAVMF